LTINITPADHPKPRFQSENIAAVENSADNYYHQFVSPKMARFGNKIGTQHRSGFPAKKKMLDDVTSTDDRITINAVVDFKESSTIDTYVCLTRKCPTYRTKAKADANSELGLALCFVNAPPCWSLCAV
jgi:hypothetical protein